ncbi:MAG: LLM class flavin-dependent oxidoreductase, partial [Desulfurellaceae bacterium]|nr:LLM class flavin-dependent oxidoreductase [Desulfurellaceae bacterium]
SDEYLRAMKTLWTQPDPEFEGEFVSFSDIECEPKPLQQPPPIWLGGHSARAMRRVVEFGDGWLAVPKSVAAFHDSLGALRVAAEQAGRAMSDIQIMISPMYVDSVDAYVEEFKRYSAMGYDSFFATLPFWARGLDGIQQAMDDFARKMNM